MLNKLTDLFIFLLACLAVYSLAVKDDPIEKAAMEFMDSYPVLAYLTGIGLGVMFIVMGIGNNKNGDRGLGGSRILRGSVLVFIGGVILLRRVT